MRSTFLEKLSGATRPARGASPSIPTRYMSSPCRSALDVVASFTTPVDIVYMHNLFLQEVVNGMVHVHVMYVCNPYVICESRFLSAGWSLGAVILLYNDLRVGFSM